MSENPFIIKKEKKNPFIIGNTPPAPQHDPNFVDPNMSHHSNDDIAFASGALDDMPGRPKEEKEDLGVFGTFKGVLENMATVLSLPGAAAVAGYNALDNSAQQIGKALWTEDGQVSDLFTKEALLPDPNQFSGDFADNVYIADSPEAQQVAENIGDAVPREAWRTLEALPPVAVAAGPMKLGMVANRMNQQVINRGKRMLENKNFLSGRSSGVQFLPDEAIDAMEHADPNMKALYLRQLEESRSLRNGFGNTDASAYGVLADQFQHRATLLAQAGRGYLDDMAKAREKIARGEVDRAGNADGSVVVRTDGTVLKRTGKLREELDGVLKDEFNIKVGPNGQLDFSLSPIAEGHGKLKKAIQRFWDGTGAAGNGYTNNLTSFDELDYLKKYLQRASYNNTRHNGPGGEANALIQRMSGMVNGTLRKISPEYAAANDGLAEVIETFKDLRSATGIDVDVNREMFKGQEWRKLALNTRKIASNYNAGIDLDATWKKMDDALRGESQRIGKDGQLVGHVTPEQFAAIDGVNPRQLAIFGSYMEALHGAGKPNSFKSLVEAGVANGANHGENFVANALWGNQVGASAAGYKWVSQNLPTQGMRDRAAGREVAKKLDRQEEVRVQIEEAIKEMLKR